MSQTWLGRAWGVMSDLLIATAIVWALPLLLGILRGIYVLARGTS